MYINCTEAKLIGSIRLSYQTQWVFLIKSACQLTLKCFKHSIFPLFKLLEFIYIAEPCGRFMYLDTRVRSSG